MEVEIPREQNQEGLARDWSWGVWDLRTTPGLLAPTRWVGVLSEMGRTPTGPGVGGQIISSSCKTDPALSTVVINHYLGSDVFIV